MTHAGRRPILVVTRGLDSVGTGRQVEIAAEALRGAGHDVRIAVTTGGGSSPGRLARAGFPVDVLSRRPRAGLLAAVELARLARDTGAGGVVAHGRGQACVAVAAARLAPRLRTLCVVDLPPRRGLETRALRGADRVVVPDEAVALRCGAAGVDAARIEIVPPGIEPASAAGLSRGQVAARLGLRPDTVWTLCVAPLDPAAHVDRLLWAIDQLGVVHRGLEHVLVGSGPMLARVRRRARLQRLSERLFVFPSLECLPDLLPRVRLVWQPGEIASGGCLLDGMAHGVAAVAVDGLAARRLVADDQTGRVVAADPISELPRRALGIIEDDALAARYGSAARQRAASLFPAARSTAALLAAVERTLG